MTSAVALAILAQPSALGQRSAYFSYPAPGLVYPYGQGYMPGLGLATTGQTGVQVMRRGWPTIITNAPHIGVYYDNNPPYYYSPSSSLGYGRNPSPLGYGYPSTIGRRYNPAAPLIFDESPWYWPRTNGGPPLIEIARRTDPALTGLAPPPPASAAPPPPTPAELGAAALGAGAYEEAAALFAGMIDGQDDAAASAGAPPALSFDHRRALALALVGARRFDEAIAAALVAERQAPASAPFNALALLSSPSEMRRLTNAAVASANRAGAPDAWRLVAFLMDAGQRPETAERMRRRAEALERPPEPVVRPRPSPADEPHGPARFSMPDPESQPPPESDPESATPEAGGPKGQRANCQRAKTTPVSPPLPSSFTI